MTKNMLLKIAHHTFEQEIKTLRTVQQSISEEFSEVIKELHACQGRIILSGIGKSAIIGQKISATLNSTGKSSVFLHAGDAVHGDLGLLQKKDIVICLSKSGNTEELKVLVPLLKSIGIRVIGMVSEEQSFLARHADNILYVPVAEEADPYNLAPTNSTTAQLVMGDALAMCLLELNGFTREQFAELHPGGSLGKKLYLRVVDLIDKKNLPRIAATANLRQTIIEMTSHRLGAAVVTDAHDLPIGIITDGDLRRMLQNNHDSKNTVAGDIMTRKPKTIDQEAKAVEALNTMRKHSITQIVVTQEGKYCGILHIHDLLREGIV